MAGAHRAAGDVELAAACLEQARTIAEGLDDTRLRATIRANEGLLRLTMGRPTDAVACLALAEQDMSRAGDLTSARWAGWFRALATVHATEGGGAPSHPTDDAPGRRATAFDTHRAVAEARVAVRRGDVVGARAILGRARRAGWPDEKGLPMAMANRVYVALSTLRKRGLRSVLVRRAGGYGFDPAVEVRLLPPRRARR